MKPLVLKSAAGALLLTWQAGATQLSFILDYHYEADSGTHDPYMRNQP
ncbi:MAG TPA: hypothetical protein VMV94_20090 [Phycisphaerae bacterium]|nr:hypothetical protein [Phycisphaerae bacterium]